MKFIAKPDTWYKEGTEAKLINYLYTDVNGDKVGLFEGLRICQDPKSEGNVPIGTERHDDQEVCGYDEFIIIEDEV